MLGLIMSVVWLRVPLGEDNETFTTLDAWALHQACNIIDHCLGTQGDVIGCGLVRPSRGCRIYCYSGTKGNAANGHGLVQPGDSIAT